MADPAILASAALAMLSAVPEPAGTAGRAPGDRFHHCSIIRKFSLPGFAGPPVWARPRQPNAPAKPGEAIEQIDASLEVDEKDGVISNLSISWVQSGGMGWPYVWRADLHPIYLTASFRQAEAGPAGTGPAFDHRALKIRMSVLSARKLRHALAFRLWRDGQAWDSLSLGGPAHLPAWGKSAEVSIEWSELAAYAGDHRWLHYELYRPRPEGRTLVRQTVSKGRVDLSIIPAVLEEFLKAEEALRANVPTRRGCEAEVELEQPEGAEI